MDGFVPYPSSYQLRTFGSWSRRVKKDMHRVEAASDNPDLLVTAFQGREGETAVFVNRSQHRITASISPGGKAFRYLERTSQYCQNQVERLPITHENVLKLSIDPGEIITLSSVELNK
jgi:hypothetical protein